MIYSISKTRSITETRVANPLIVPKLVIYFNYSNFSYPCQRTIDNLNDLWSQLEELLNKKRKRLEHEQKLDCWREKSQKIEIWIEEKLPTAENENYGESIGEVNALKDALLRLQNEINGKSMPKPPWEINFILRLFDVNGRPKKGGR